MIRPDSAAATLKVDAPKEAAPTAGVMKHGSVEVKPAAARRPTLKLRIEGMKRRMASLIADELSKSVSDADRTLTILDRVSLTIAAGQTLAVTGASGSGKSTLLGILAGLDTPSSGRLTVDGQSMFDLDEDERARWRAGRVGFVFQSFQLLPQFSAIENVMLPLELARRSDARERAAMLLERVGLGDRLKHDPRKLSGGEQQRVALARAFAPSPRWLFADEPTGSLDHATGQRIGDLLFELNAESGTTLILVTHDRELAGRCGRVVTLDEGRLVSDTLNDGG